MINTILNAQEVENTAKAKEAAELAEAKQIVAENSRSEASTKLDTITGTNGHVTVLKSFVTSTD